jgi:hypothetical protein
VGRWVGLLLVVQAEPVAAAVPSPCGKDEAGTAVSRAWDRRGAEITGSPARRCGRPAPAAPRRAHKFSLVAVAQSSPKRRSDHPPCYAKRSARHGPNVGRLQGRRASGHVASFSPARPSTPRVAGSSPARGAPEPPARRQEPAPWPRPGRRACQALVARAPGCLTSWPRPMSSFRSCTQARRRLRSMTLRSTSCMCRYRFRPSPRLSGERDVMATEFAAERGGGLGRVP